MAADEMMKDTALSLQQDLLKMNEQKIDKLIKVVRNRRQVQKKLAFIMKSIKTSKERVKQFQDENNLRLNEIFTILERTDKIARLSQSQQDGQNFLPELMELVGNFSPDVTVETLRLKMATSMVRKEAQRIDGSLVPIRFSGDDEDFYSTLRRQRPSDSDLQVYPLSRPISMQAKRPRVLTPRRRPHLSFLPTNIQLSPVIIITCLAIQSY